MFNLVKYRYLFLIISLIVIIPGTISLIFAHLDVGIDFRGGSNIELRPQRQVTATEVRSWLSPLKLADEQIVLGDVGNTASVAGNRLVWVQLNTLIDGSVQSTITNDLQSKYPGVKTLYTNITTSSGKTVTLATVSSFASTPSISEVQTLLSKLPNTTTGAVTSSATPTATSTATAKATATTTAKATATTTAKATATPAATATSTTGTSSTSSTSSTGTIPVSVQNVSQGTSTQTVTIQTSSQLKDSDLPTIYSTILNHGGPYMYSDSVSEVGPAVASQTTTYSFLAVLAASVLILLYISLAFRKVSKPWRYGACAIIALLHDVLVVLGIFSILGWLFHVQVDALFITALLTVVGFSVHDTIVVFDRIRENMQRRTTESFEQVVNASLVQTLARSLNTSLTVILTLTALTLFGGVGSVHNFTLALLIGIVSGTYSSIFNASMLLVIWEKGELGFDRFNRNTGRTVSRREERELARSRS